MKFIIDLEVLRNSRCFVKKVFLKNFANFAGKHLWWSLFLTKSQTQGCNFIKKRLQHRWFPVKFVEFSRTPIFKNICERLLLGFNNFLIFLTVLTIYLISLMFLHRKEMFASVISPPHSHRFFFFFFFLIQFFPF